MESCAKPLMSVAVYFEQTADFLWEFHKQEIILILGMNFCHLDVAPGMGYSH